MIRLVVLFGGRSAEHEVSCVTAVSVLKALDPARYQIVPVGITREGLWVQADEARRLLESGGPAALPPSIEAKGQELAPFQTIGPANAAPDAPTVVLPLLHGPFGEDGTIQGLCEMAGVPYVGSGVLGSAVAMDKITAKKLMEAAGLPIPRYVAFRAEADADQVEAELGWPVFVKPSNLGSSVGVAKARNRQEFEVAADDALRYDEWLIVEEAVTGREIECGVLGDLEPEASVVGEVRPSHEFYDYEDKYVDGKAELLVPAPLPDGVAGAVRRLAVEAFKAVRAEGMARVDFFYDEARSAVLINEVNTIPGFTPISMYPRLWEASGVPYPALLDRLVQFALDRQARRDGRIGRALRDAPPDT